MAGQMHPTRPTGPALGACRPAPGPTTPTHPKGRQRACVSTCCSYPASGESALLASCSSGAASDRTEMAILAANSSSLPARAMNSPAVGLWAATPRLAAVESDLVLIGMPEACARDCNAGLFDAALYVGHGCMGWHALTIRAADENLLDLSIATKGGLACRSVVVSMVPAAAAGVEFA